MNSHANKTQENKSNLVQKSSNNNRALDLSLQHQTAAQTSLQNTANNSEQVKQALQLQAVANANSSLSIQKKGIEEEELQMKSIPVQRQSIKEDESLQGKFALPIQKKENSTGLPDNLKSGIENLSGYSMDDVKVHYNSDKPAQLQAHAYAQGTDIHIASGQEKHLPHEAWHVVQQKQGRVQPTLQMKGNVNVNDDTGLENEADVMGQNALNLSANNTSANQLKSTTSSSQNAAVQRYLKIGPVIVEEDAVDFIVSKIIEEAAKIMTIWENAEKPLLNNPSYVAFQRGIPLLLINNTKKVAEIVARWAAASGVGMAVISESVSSKITGVRGNKAEWKEFDDYFELALAVGYELDPHLRENQEFEVELGAQIIRNDEIAQKLNSLRITLMQWIVRQYSSTGSALATFKMKFKLGGSYNFSGSSSVSRDFDALLVTSGLSVIDNIEILHDLMEITSDQGAGSIFQKFGKVIAPEVKKEAYNQIGVNENGELYEMVPMMTKSDHGPGGSAWKASKHFILKIYEVELNSFKTRMSERDLDEIELVDFDEPVEDELDPKSRELSDRYSGKKGEKLSKAMAYKRRPPETALERLRDSILMGLDLKASFKPSDTDKLNKRSKGRHNVGTRDEYDPVTVLARANGVPIEAGRSMTTARMLELCTLALNDNPEGRELHSKGESELDALAQGIFAYWAAQYNQSLTPIHTYHEVMDVARKYGVEYRPFHYKVFNGLTMELQEFRPMNKELDLKTSKNGIEAIEERRERSYRPTDIQRDRLLTLGREAVWIDPNGDCLFNALKYLGAPIGSVDLFRRELGNYLNSHYHKYSGFVTGISQEQLVMQIKKPGSFFNLGGDMTPMLISDFLAFPFSILNVDGSYHHINGGNANRLIIRVTNPLPHYHSSKSSMAEVELQDF
ncbi:DUF4157 domain-containing protein [uncultured Flavobacterium sp.]|uniref:eCIS core domain-containing protein n=1 Tax=uncultured Flavobacterium sp. TaxID=165435 RepID=UPI0025EE2836|nr:DUF4157 domain-containing protein [uncultured Flavobacterium sp.]